MPREIKARIPDKNGFHDPPAERPRPPLLGQGAARKLSKEQQYLETRRGQEHRSVLRGLILLAAVVLVFSLIWSGWQRIFYHGWWRQW